MLCISFTVESKDQNKQCYEENISGDYKGWVRILLVNWFIFCTLLNTLCYIKEYEGLVRNS